MTSPTHRGAYGLALTGELAAHAALRAVPIPKGLLTLWETQASRRPALVGSGHVRVQLADDSVLDARDMGDGTYKASLEGGPERTHDDLVHPYLAPIAALVHRWRGVPALHGAAVGSRHGVVALIGSRGQGKTTTAAALVQEAGLSLLSDDLIVVENGEVLPGPLSLDLRPDASELLGLKGERVRNGERLRRLAPPLTADPSASLTLRLCVHLEWGDRTLVQPLPAAKRLVALSSQLYWPGIGAPALDLLDLVATPQVILQRPTGRTGLNEAIEAIAALTA